MMGFYHVKRIFGDTILKSKNLQFMYPLFKAKYFCYCCRKQRNRAKELKEEYEILEDILNESLDSIQLVKYIQQVKLLCKAFFSDSMTFLIPYLLMKFKEQERQSEKELKALKKETEKIGGPSLAKKISSPGS